MLDIKEQICSLCQAKANFYLVDHGDKKYFDCPNCKRYLICIDAEYYILESIEEVRINAAIHAQGSVGDELTVFSLEATASYKRLFVTYMKKEGFNL